MVPRDRLPSDSPTPAKVSTTFQDSTIGCNMKSSTRKFVGDASQSNCNIVSTLHGCPSSTEERLPTGAVAGEHGVCRVTRTHVVDKAVQQGLMSSVLKASDVSHSADTVMATCIFNSVRLPSLLRGDNG